MDDDGRIDAVLAAARMAPSTYNSQPWRIVVARTPQAAARLGAGDDRDRCLWLLEDPARAIPVADPAGAETSISIGACLANVVLAARQAGWAAQVELVDDPQQHQAALRDLGALRDGERPVAVVRMRCGADAPPSAASADRRARLSVFLDGRAVELHDGGDDLQRLLATSADGGSTLFDRRRSERGPYLRRPLERDVVRRLAGAASAALTHLPPEPLALFVTADPDRIARAQHLARRSTRRSLTHTGIARETMSWFRPSRQAAQRTGDGEPIDAAGYRGAELWLARRALDGRLGPLAMKLGGAWRVARRNSGVVADSAVLMAWASPPADESPWTPSPHNQRRFLATGCAVQTVWLGLAAERAGLQFMTNCLLFADSRREVAEIVGLPEGYVPLTLQRAGYPEAASDEPPIRRPLTDVVAFA